MRELKIAYGDSRLSKRWVNKKITFKDLCERFRIPRRTSETVAEYKTFTKDRRDAAKDAGGFVLGHLKGGRRKKDTVESRSGITLEAVWETAKMFWQSGRANIDRIGAAVLGVFLCLAGGVDLFLIIGVPLEFSYAGMVLSGLLISRGANFIHDFLTSVAKLKETSA